MQFCYPFSSNKLYISSHSSDTVQHYVHLMKWRASYTFMYFDSVPLFTVCSLTREDFARAPSYGYQILDQVLTVCGLAAARFAKQHDGLILPGGK